MCCVFVFNFLFGLVNIAWLNKYLKSYVYIFLLILQVSVLFSLPILCHSFLHSFSIQSCIYWHWLLFLFRLQTDFLILFHLTKIVLPLIAQTDLLLYFAVCLCEILLLYYDRVLWLIFKSIAILSCEIPFDLRISFNRIKSPLDNIIPQWYCCHTNIKPHRLFGRWGFMPLVFWHSVHSLFYTGYNIKNRVCQSI